MGTKVRLYDIYNVPLALGKSEAWVLAQADNNRVSAFDQCCIRLICGVRWTHIITSDEIRRCTLQPTLRLICGVRWTDLLTSDEIRRRTLQPTLRLICGVRWTDLLTSDEIRRRTLPTSLSRIIAECRPALFGHVAMMECPQQHVEVPASQGTEKLEATVRTKVDLDRG